MRYNTKLKMEDVFPERTDRLCRRCQKTLTGKQRKWCSKECSDTAFHELMIAKGSSTHIRAAVLERDKGICAECKCDTEKMRRIQKAMRSSAHHWAKESDYKIRNFYENEAIWNKFEDMNGNFWQADHIQEVCNGGGHSLDNLQTLCIECHKIKTRSLFSKQKEKRINEKHLPLFDAFNIFN